MNDNKILNEIINKEDKRRNKMNILVNENNKTIIKDNIKNSKEIICPKCNENILIKINEYKINLFKSIFRTSDKNAFIFIINITPNFFLNNTKLSKFIQFINYLIKNFFQRN